MKVVVRRLAADGHGQRQHQGRQFSRGKVGRSRFRQSIQRQVKIQSWAAGALQSCSWMMRAPAGPVSAVRARAPPLTERTYTRYRCRWRWPRCTNRALRFTLHCARSLYRALSTPRGTLTTARPPSQLCTLRRAAAGSCVLRPLVLSPSSSPLTRGPRFKVAPAPTALRAYSSSLTTKLLQGQAFSDPDPTAFLLPLPQPSLPFLLSLSPSPSSPPH